MSEDSQVSPSFPPESIKVIAESIGISAVGDDVAKELAEEITFRLKLLIQVRTEGFILASREEPPSSSNIDPHQFYSEINLNRN